LALALLLALAGCAGPVAVPPVAGPGWGGGGPALMTDDLILTTDRVRLPLRGWLPPGEPRAVVLALHGFNDYSASFRTVGPALTAAGMALYAYDQRGFGAGDRPGHWPGTATLTADLASAVSLIHRRHPAAPLHLLGESMGAAVILAALAGEGRAPEWRRQVAGVVLAAPAVWGGASLNPLYRLTLELTRAVAPGWCLTAPRELGIRPSDNLEMLRALGRDPLVLKGARVDALAGMVELMDLAERAAPRFDLPGLILLGAHDQIIPPAAAERFVARLPPGRQRVVRYPAGWHLLLRDLQAATVVRDLLAWLADPAAPLPSGAGVAPRP